MEKGFIFFPEKTILDTPSAIGLKFEDLYFTSPDGVRINGWFIPFLRSKTTLLWFHGNAGNISHRVDMLRHLHRETKVNIMMIDYREYGRSEGVVSERGTYQDAMGAYDYLLARSEIDSDKIIGFGQSLGAAVAVELALQRSLQGLILEAPFTSIREMAKVLLPWLPIGGLLSTKYDNLSKMDQVTVPLLVLQGDRDEVIPYSHGKRIFEAAREPKAFHTIFGAGHNDTYLVGGKEYFQTIEQFVKGLP